MKQVLYFCSLIILVLSCTEESVEAIEAPAYNVAPVFEKYVQEFIDEGAKRGRNIDFSDSGLSVAFSDFPLDNAAGLCSLRRHSVIIDKENWFRFSERFRSYLLFHELGHCELDRLHKNDQFDDGTWKSIMRGDPFKGTNNRIPVPYFGFRKDYYIDELFSPASIAPAWSNALFDYNTNYQRENIAEFIAPDRLNERFTNVAADYEFEVEFTLIQTANTRTKLEWGVTGQNYYVYIIPTWGFYIGVNLDGNDNDLYYSSNINLVGGETIRKISVRQKEGHEQVFINDEFIFHIDPQANLDYVKLTAMDGEQLNNQFEIDSFSLYSLQ